MTDDKELRTYLRPRLGALILALLPLAFGIYGLTLPGSTGASLGAFAICLVIAVLIAIFPLLSLIGLNKALKEREADGTLAQAVEDFSRSTPYVNDELRLGETYVFGRHSGQLLQYTDIRNAYQYVHKTNGVEDSRILRVVSKAGKTVDLCKLKRRGKADDELVGVLRVMLAHNNQMTIGYRR